MTLKHRKVGIMGGTFDPIHLGHLILGEKAFEQFELEKVLFMPSGNPPHKRNRLGRATDLQRTEMVKRAIADNPHFELSLMEMHEEGYTYTFRTLEQLNREHPDTEYYFIIGADSLYSFETWMEPGRIARAATLVAATRNQTPKEELLAEIDRVSGLFDTRILLLDTMNIDISSQNIRAWAAQGKSLRYYVPDDVRIYIEENRLYQTPEIQTG